MPRPLSAAYPRRAIAHGHRVASAHLGLIIRLAFAGSMTLGLGASLPAHAQVDAQSGQYNISAGPLADVLNQYAQQAGVSIAMDARQLRGLTSPGLQGRYGIDAGFNQLLRGSGYAAHRTESGYVLRPAASSPSAAPMLPTVTAVASSPSQGYVTARSSAATKTDTALLETPQAVSVVTRQELNDRNVQTLIEAVSYTPGVRTEQSGFDPRFDVFTVRGFDVTYTGIYRDGLRLPGANMSVFKVEPYSVEDVTVLRGPSSALYGQGSPGGLVDITSKRPVDEPFGEVELMTGNFQRKQGQFDLGGRADDEGQWKYRLTGVVRDAGSPNTDGGGNNDITSIAPAVTWQPNSDTSVTLLSEYLKSRTPASLPYYAWSEDGDADFGYALGDYNRQDQEQFRIGYLAEHRLNDTITVRQNLRYGRINTHVRYNALGDTDTATNTISRSTGYVHDKLKSFVVDNHLQADFKTGNIAHKLLVGLDYSYLGLDGGIGYGAASDLDASTREPLGATEDPPTNTARYRQRQRQTGLYVQEQAQLDGWIVTLTGRHDWSTTTADDLITHTREKAVDRKFTGRAGLTHVFDNGVAPYMSYSTSFAPTSGVDSSGQAFQPTTARQVEAGVKYAPNNMNSYVAASLFELKQSNTLVTDENNPLFQTQTGKVRSRGIELEAMLDLAEGLRVHGSYTYLAAINVSGDANTDGRTLSGTPRHNFSLWTDYTFPSSTALAGLGLGAGLRYVGTSWGDASNTFHNAAHLLVDAKIGYDLGRVSPALKGWSAQVNAQNLFNRNYIACDAGYCYQGTPRTVTASVKYRW